MSKRQMKNVTLLTYNCVDPIQSVKAMIYSSREIDFAEMVLVAHERPANLPNYVRFVESRFHDQGHAGSCRFTFEQLPDLVHTDYCLQVHDDGFVINPHLWDDNWYGYDYIGAPWKNFGQLNRVGNGGFVFKSNRFIQLTRKVSYRGTHDDGELTNDYHHFFTACGCNYAPVHVAMRFSLESRIPECEYNLDNCFGFHGRGSPHLTSVHDGFYQQFQEKCKLLDTVEI